MKKPAIHGFRIFKQEELSRTFIRVITEQLDHCLQLEVKFDEHPDFSTHEIRKSTKRIRAVYKLFRPAIGNDRYSHGNELHSKLSGILAAHRVSAVNIETLQYLASDKRMPLNADMIARLVAEMTNRHKHFTHELMHGTGIQSNAKGILLTERQRLLAEPLPATDFKVIAIGLGNTYKQGRKCLAAMTKITDTENNHNLRKQVKSLWNQLVLLRPVWPVMINAYIRQYDHLAERLGVEHDLAELEHYLIKGEPAATAEEINLILNISGRKRQQIQRSIFPLATRLYTEKPGTFAGRLERYHREFVR